MSKALATDFYELNMAASYLRHEMTGTATFSLFCRRLPQDRGFLVAAGLEDCLAFLEDFAFDEADLEYLAAIGFDDDALRGFRDLRFTGEVWAVPEGTVLLANEPLLEVSAPLAEAQLVETYLLNQCTFQTALATKAARCRVAAAGRMDLVEFSMRRTHGIEASIAVARLSAMCGFVATSNVEAARCLKLRPAGTMAHSYVEAFDEELEAFVTFATDFPDQATFLVDTYDTMAGVEHAISAIRALELEDHAGVRLDSGDVVDLARKTRLRLDKAGLGNVRIFVSGGLDEHDLARFVAQRAPIDAVGIGTRLGVSDDAPYVDTAYKLVEYANRPVVKLSAGKATLPGPKQIFRSPGMRDTIACRDESPPGQAVPLLEMVMTGGKRARLAPTLQALRSRLEDGLADVPEQALALVSPFVPVATTSAKLRTLDDQVRARAAVGTGID
ncbi:MAG: nicotinate phosphoribosyltransferase [Acidimicrobiales bacterium]|jgi:nicotinate phosphoribosyltransferase